MCCVVLFGQCAHVSRSSVKVPLRQWLTLLWVVVVVLVVVVAVAVVVVVVVMVVAVEAMIVVVVFELRALVVVACRLSCSWCSPSLSRY